MEQLLGSQEFLVRSPALIEASAFSSSEEGLLSLGKGHWLLLQDQRFQRNRKVSGLQCIYLYVPTPDRRVSLSPYQRHAFARETHQAEIEPSAISCHSYY